jgi:hypothetical protein
LGNGPLNTFTGSLRSEVNGIEAYTASLKGAIEVSGQNVNVLGMITAQQFNVTYVSSSVMYQSGSTKFGNSGDDKHEFTGSVDVTGTGRFTGDVGVGVSPALRRLHVLSGAGIAQFQSNTTSGTIYFGDTNSSVIDNQGIGSRGDSIAISAGGIDRFTLNSTGTITASGDFTVGSPTANATINISGDNSGGDTFLNFRADFSTIKAQIQGTKFGGTGGNLYFKTLQSSVLTTAMAINESKVGINTDVFNHKFQVKSGINTSTTTVMSLQQATNGAIKDAVGFGVSINNGGEATNAADLLISTATGGSLTTKVNVGSNGDVTVSNGNLVIGTSGKGIDFSATSNGSGTTSSELLNDYEEGTWTGTLKGSVSDPTTPVTATGYYTKVGNTVFATIAINSATTTGASGNVSVSGLPFTSAATNNSHGSVMSTFYDFDGGTSLVALLGSSTTNVFIMTSGDDADWNDVLHVAGTGKSLRFSITYFV